MVAGAVVLPLRRDLAVLPGLVLVLELALALVLVALLLALVLLQLLLAPVLLPSRVRLGSVSLGSVRCPHP